MATIQNSDLTRELVQGAKIAQSYEQVPTQLAEKVVPFMEVNPKLLSIINIVKNNAAVNATTSTIYTTPPDRDFYLCTVSMSTIKDATSTSVVSQVLAFVDGVNTVLLNIASITLTAQENCSSITFPLPIKIDKGTNITVTNSTNVANIRTNAVISGYTVDV